jgi:hypothetical protein
MDKVKRVLGKPLTVCVGVAVLYFLSNLTFGFGLDDSVQYIYAQQHVGDAGVSDLLGSIRHLIFSPPAADSLELYRPLRFAYTWILVRASPAVPWLPDLVSALIAGACAYVLARCNRASALPPPTASLAVLWFFSCIPVVAMGHVVLVCQFVMITGMYLVVALFQRYAVSGRVRWLVLAGMLTFVFGLYGEAMLITPVAVGLLGLLALARRNVRVGFIALASAAVGGFLVLGNGFLLTGDPGQFHRAFRSVLLTRGYDVSGMGGNVLEVLAGRVRHYGSSFRPSMFTGIFFSIGPVLFGTGLLAFTILAVFQRRYGFLAVLAATALLSVWSVPLAIGAGLIVLALFRAAEQPILASLLVAGLLVLGPLFVIDTHVTYVLPALAGLLSAGLSECHAALRSRGPRLVLGSVLVLLAAVGVSNYAGGAYFSARLANDNQRFAACIGAAIRDGCVVTNFRHAADLYLFANAGRKPGEFQGDLFFTATVPWPLWEEEDRAVRDEQRLEQCLGAASARAKGCFFLLVDHDRLPNKMQFHGPRFLTNPHYDYRLRDVHVFQATVPFLDPGFLSVDYFYRRGLSAGFIGYPVFPDMIDDVGVEYGRFTKRLFACYRLLEVKRRDEGEASAAPPHHVWDARMILPDYLGYEVVAEGQRILSHCPTAGDGETREPIVSERLDVVLQKIRTRSQRAGPPAGESGAAALPVRLIEEGVKGFNILACGDRFFGLAQDEGAFDLGKARRREYRRCVEGDSVREVKRLIQNGVARRYP